MYRVAVRNLTKILIRVYEHSVEIRDTAIFETDASAFYAPYIPLTTTGIKAGALLPINSSKTRTLPGGASMRYGSSVTHQIIARRPTAEILAQLREMVEWCRDRHGPGAVGAEQLPGRQHRFDPKAQWGLGHAPGKNAVFYFRDANAAFEFKMRWV